MKNKFINATALLIGTVIGAGFLGVPYVFAKAGFLVGTLHLMLITAIILFINLGLGEISLRTKGNHQLTGYAERYLGKRGRQLMFFAMIFGIYAALLAYLVGEGKSISFLIFQNEQFYLFPGIIFWFITSLIAASGIKALKKYEPLSVAIILVIIISVILLFFTQINPQNLSTISTQHFFLPFGVILFAMLGFSALPEMEILLKKQERKMKKAILLGTLIPAILYFFFALTVVGRFGQSTPRIATFAFSEIGGGIFILLGIFTMFTAYLALSVALEDMYIFDYHFTKKQAVLASSLPPLFLFIAISLFNLASFTKIISLSGTVSGGLTGVLVLMMMQKAKRKGNRKPEYSLTLNKKILLALTLILILGIFLEIFV